MTLLFELIFLFSMYLAIDIYLRKKNKTDIKRSFLRKRNSDRHKVFKMIEYSYISLFIVFIFLSVIKWGYPPVYFSLSLYLAVLYAFLGFEEWRCRFSDKEYIHYWLGSFFMFIFYFRLIFYKYL
ncbi:DUF4181 domain-containing protein [Bacillus sp. 1P06AnD]|uniref:DUF4181 domain-containing protein n=1 Tax=Bacillus sp. 1P06AnD TaxID=3132208 RepID=UPI0039A2B40D